MFWFDAVAPYLFSFFLLYILLCKIIKDSFRGICGITTSFVAASSAIPLFRPYYVGFTWDKHLKGAYICPSSSSLLVTQLGLPFQRLLLHLPYS